MSELMLIVKYIQKLCLQVNK